MIASFRVSSAHLMICSQNEMSKGSVEGPKSWHTITYAIAEVP